MSLYAIRLLPCGCLKSTNPAPPTARLGEERTHPDKSRTVVMMVQDAAVVPEKCKEHRAAPAPEAEQIGLFA